MSEKLKHQKLMRLLALVFMGFWLASCASLDEASKVKSAQLIHIQTLQKEAKILAADKTGAAAYAPNKAISWLDFALNEYYEDDKTDVIVGAIHEAEQIINTLKSGADASTVGLETPIISGSEKVRDDLWEKSSALKQSPYFACGAKTLANLDVQLIWTGHDYWEAGWSHAKTSSEVADNLAFEAEQAIKQCASLKDTSAPTEHPATSSITEVIVEKYNFSADALFAFNQSNIEHLVLGGKHKLDKLIADISTWQQVESIEIHGYADEIGSKSYNQKLSEARANAVRDYMSLHGVKATITAIGHGASDSVSDCSTRKKHEKRISCLQGDRRVELVVQGKK